MHVILVLTYPIYHDHVPLNHWINRQNRTKWLPEIITRLGHSCELWVAADKNLTLGPSDHRFGDYLIRIFETDRIASSTKKHVSNELTTFARKQHADHYLLKGTDGGIGLDLMEQYLLPERRPFSFIIGGKYYTRHVPHATHVLYETELQRKSLEAPGWRFWRRAVPPTKLFRLPKSVNTETFRPLPDAQKRWDIVSVGRILNRYKNYNALSDLASDFRVAVAGTGPALEKMRKAIPSIEWVGYLPHDQIPSFMNAGRVFFHPSSNDYYPRVIAEAMACGVPPLAFADSIAEDVILPGTGERLPRQGFDRVVASLVRNEAKVERMSSVARSVACNRLNKYSSFYTLRRILGVQS